MEKCIGLSDVCVVMFVCICYTQCIVMTGGEIKFSKIVFILFYSKIHFKPLPHSHPANKMTAVYISNDDILLC